MRVVIIYRDASDHGREVRDYLRDVQMQTGHNLEEMSPDTRDGAAFCQVYDVVAYPTIIALSDDGKVQNMWSGRPLPMISEVSYYV